MILNNLEWGIWKSGGTAWFHHSVKMDGHFLPPWQLGGWSKAIHVNPKADRLGEYCSIDGLTYAHGRISKLPMGPDCNPKMAKRE